MNPKMGRRGGLSPKNNIPLFFLQDKGLIDAGHESSDFNPTGNHFFFLLFGLSFHGFGGYAGAQNCL